MNGAMLATNQEPGFWPASGSLNEKMERSCRASSEPWPLSKLPLQETQMSS